MPRIEATEKPRYRKAHDIGRIVINEGPEEKQPLKKRDIPKRDKVKEKHVDMETCDTFDGGPGVREDVVKVGRLNIIDHKITPRESGRPKIHEMVIYVCL